MLSSLAKGAPKTEVDAVAEGKVRVGRAVYVEPVRIRELCAVAIRGGDPQDDDLVGADRVSLDIHVGRGTPGQPGKRWSAAQYLLDGGGQPGRIGPQLRGGVGVLVERDDGVAQEGGRGDVAGDQEQPDEPDDLLVVEPFPVDLGVSPARSSGRWRDGRGDRWMCARR